MRLRRTKETVIPIAEHSLTSYIKGDGKHWQKCDNCEYVTEKRSTISIRLFPAKPPPQRKREEGVEVRARGE